MRPTSRLDATTRDDEHAGPRGVDPLLDQAGVLVDVVDADRIAVDGAADRDEQLEEVAGQRRQAVAGPAAPVPVVAIARRSGRRCRRHRRWRAAARSRSAGRGARRRSNRRSVRRVTRVDPADLARQGQPLELGVDRRVARRSRSRLDSCELGVDIAAHDGFDAVHRGFGRGPAQLVGDAVRDHDRHPDDDGDGRRDDDRAEARPPRDVGRPIEGRPGEGGG